MAKTDEEFAQLEARFLAEKAKHKHAKDINAGLLVSLTRAVNAELDKLIAEFRMKSPSLNRDGAIQALSMAKDRVPLARINTALLLDE